MRYLLLAASLLLASCATTTELPRTTRADTVLTDAGLASVGKLVIRGNVTIQQGNGNSVVGKDKTGQRAQALSTGANSPVTASQKKAPVPVWVFVLVGVLSIVGWEWLSHQAPTAWLKWLPWRAAKSP